MTIQAGPDSHEQRLDNFLLKICKGVPKTHIFRIIRSGEVRVNKGRAQIQTRIFEGDLIRIPPIRSTNQGLKEENSGNTSSSHVTQSRRVGESLPVLFEDEGLLAVNKPSGLAVHGGSGESSGLIESLRIAREEDPLHYELVHRIDRETSGVLLIAKKRSFLRKLQEQLRHRAWKKTYLTLVSGHWPDSLQTVDLPLKKVQAAEKEKKVFVSPDGDQAKSLFKPVKRYLFEKQELTLLQVRILTGRTHQIRVHTSHHGYPIVGDDRYGHFEMNKHLARNGLKRMFLHAWKVEIVHPVSLQSLLIEAPLASELQDFINALQEVKR